METQRQEAQAEVALENDRSVEIERDAIDAQCRKYKVHIKEVEPDGHWCALFRPFTSSANTDPYSLAACSPRSPTKPTSSSSLSVPPPPFFPLPHSFLPLTAQPGNLRRHPSPRRLVHARPPRRLPPLPPEHPRPGKSYVNRGVWAVLRYGGADGRVGWRA